MNSVYVTTKAQGLLVYPTNPPFNLPGEPWSNVKLMACFELCAPFSWLARHSTRASNMSMAGPDSMISPPGWLASFDSELCSVHCGDEFGLEFN